MKNYNFSLRALALAVATLFATTGCGDDSTEEGGGNGPETPASSLKIVVSDVQGTSATVATTPASSSLTYMVDVITKEEFEAYDSAEALAAADVEAIKAEALAEGSALDAYLVATGALRKGVKSEVFKGLEVSTDYVAFAYGLSTAGEITTAVSTEEFTTLESDPEPDKVTFTIETSNVTATSVGVKITPSDNDVDYYWDILPTSSFEQMTEAEVVEAFNQLYQTYYGETLYEQCSTGTANEGMYFLDSSTEYTLFAFTYTEEGEAGEFSTQKITTRDASILVKMVPGKYDEASESYVNPDAFITIGIGLAKKENPITSLHYFCSTTDDVNNYIKSYEGVENLMADVATIPNFSLGDMLEDLNTEGSIGIYFSNRSPETEYTILLLATDSEGVTSIYSTEETTAAATEASEAYNAWLGDWTVTSSGTLSYTQNAGFSETDTPMTFDISVKAQKLNGTYEVSGWGISADRLALPCVANFNSASGTFSIVNDQVLQAYTDGDKVVSSICKYPQGYTFITGNYDAVTATISAEGSATATGYQGYLNASTTFEVKACDYFFVAGEDIYFLDNADGSEGIAYPLLPFTLTKKAATTEPDAEPATPETSNLRKAVKTAKTLAPIGMKEAAIQQHGAIEMPSTDEAFDRLSVKAGSAQAPSKQKLAHLLLKK